VYTYLRTNLVRDFSSTYTSQPFPSPPQPSLILVHRPSWIQQNWPNCRPRLRLTGSVSNFSLASSVTTTASLHLSPKNDHFSHVPGGKGTMRRKVVRKSKPSAAQDDKKLQAALKKLNVQPIAGVEEVNMFREDGNVLHFTTPKGTSSS